MSITTEARDAPWEELIHRSPYSVKVWLGYLEHKTGSSPQQRYVIYERALINLNRSYKIWRKYLQERTLQLKPKCISDKRYGVLITCYERAMLSMFKMPRLWIDYCALLIYLKKGTQTRRVFDRALQNLPLTQHEELWELYITWAKNFSVPLTTMHIFERYILYAPEQREAYITYLLDVAVQPGEAATQLQKALEDPSFVAASGRSRHSLTIQLCDICAANPTHMISKNGKTKMDVPSIIRGAISKYASGDEVGRLWCKLADYYIRLGEFVQARLVYEEAMSKVLTVRDFGIVFDAYVKVEEGVLTVMMQSQMEEDDEDDENDEDEDEDGEGEESIEDRLARLENLMERRPLLVNSVVLRQNPHNIHEWLKRIKLLTVPAGTTSDTGTGDKKASQEDPISTLSALKLSTYHTALSTVDPKLASQGKISSLHMSYCRYLEAQAQVDANNGKGRAVDLQQSRLAWKAALNVEYTHTDELAAIYCGYAEMEMRYKNYGLAHSIILQAICEPISSIKRKKALATAQGKGENRDGEFDGAVAADRVYRNNKVWCLYLDLEETLGTHHTVRAAYNRAIDLKIITVQMFLNYAAYLEESQYYEDAFRIYEQAVSIFLFPQVKVVWVTYLDKFMERYGGTKLERLRDLFEHAVSMATATCTIMNGSNSSSSSNGVSLAATQEDIVEIFLKYAHMEEKYGLPRHYLSIYERATHAVPKANKLMMYKLYISKIVSVYGLIQTRSVYESAIAELEDSDVRELCLDYAETEKQLGEIPRARAVYAHGCQFAHPKRNSIYWQRWKNFEEHYGNVDTFRDLLRLQRSIETKYSQVNYAAEDALASMAAKSSGESLKRKFVSSGDGGERGEGGGGGKILRGNDAYGYAAADGMEDTFHRTSSFIADSVFISTDNASASVNGGGGGGGGGGGTDAEINIDEIENTDENGDTENYQDPDDLTSMTLPVPRAVFGGAALAD